MKFYYNSLPVLKLGGGNFLYLILFLSFSFINIQKTYAACPTWDACAILQSSDDCTYTYIVDVDAPVSYDVHALNWNFSRTGYGDIIDAYFLFPGDELATNADLTFDASYVNVNFIDFSEAIDFIDLDGDQIVIVLNAEPGQSHAIVSGGSNQIYNTTDGFCDDQESCSSPSYYNSGETISGNISEIDASSSSCNNTTSLGVEGANVEVTRSGIEECDVETDDSGDWSCLGCDDEDYTMCVTTTCEQGCGLTDADPILLRQFILSTTTLDKKQILAGDVNRSAGVTTLDVVLIQTEVNGDPNSVDEWCRFINVSEFNQGNPLTTANDTDFPYYNNLDECIDVTSSTGTNDYYRIMMGDINESCSDCIHGDNNGEVLMPAGNDVATRSNEEVKQVQIRLPLEDVMYALAFNYNIPQGTEILEIDTELKRFMTSSNNNNFHFSWIDITEEDIGYRIRKNDPIVTIKYKGSTPTLDFTKDNLVLGYDSGILNIRTEAKGNGENDTGSIENRTINLHNGQVIKTKYLYEIATIRVFDRAGKLVDSQKSDLSENEFVFNSELPSGLYLINFSSESHSETVKFVYTR